MERRDFEAVVALQAVCFPDLDASLLWRAAHLERHISIFAEGQWVGEIDGGVVASCSNTLIAEERWLAGAEWESTVGGPLLATFDPRGTTLYGLDISVHPEHRGRGIARAFYERRFDLVRRRGLDRYGTSCRIPGYRAWSEVHPGLDQQAYVDAVCDGSIADGTLTPLLRIGLRPISVLKGSMQDPESGDAAVKLEWKA